MYTYIIYSQKNMWYSFTVYILSYLPHPPQRRWYIGGRCWWVLERDRSVPCPCRSHGSPIVWSVRSPVVPSYAYRRNKSLKSLLLVDIKLREWFVRAFDLVCSSYGTTNKIHSGFMAFFWTFSEYWTFSNPWWELVQEPEALVPESYS